MMKKIISVIMSLTIALSAFSGITASAIEDERISVDYAKVFRNALNNKILKDKSYRTCQFYNLRTGEIDGYYSRTVTLGVDKYTKYISAHILDYDNDNQPELIATFDFYDLRGLASIIYEYDKNTETVFCDKGFLNSCGGTGVGESNTIYYSDTYGFYISSMEYGRYFDPARNGRVGTTDYHFFRFKDGKPEPMLDVSLDYAPDEPTKYNGCSEYSAEGIDLKQWYHSLLDSYYIDTTQVQNDNVVYVDLSSYQQENELTRYYVKPIQIILNGSEIETDVPPTIENSRTLVPIRAITEAMGCKVDWYQESQTATISRGDISVVAQVNNNEFTVMNVNGEKTVIKNETPARNIDDRVLIPVRALCEAMGCEVVWDSDNKIVDITYDLYAIQHASFANNYIYEAFSDNGGHAKAVKNHYIDDWFLQLGNATWNGIQILKNAVTFQFPELKNELKQDEIQYELVLNDLLMSSEMTKTYEDIFTEEYGLVIIPLIDSIVFDDREDDEIQKSESKIRAAAQMAINGGVDIYNLEKPLKDYVELASQAMDGKNLADLFSNIPINSAKYNFINGTGTAMNIIESVSKIGGYYKDEINTVAIALAMQKADARFIDVLEDVKNNISSSDTDKDDKIEEGFKNAIDEFIDEFNKNRDERQAAVIKAFGKADLKAFGQTALEVARYSLMSGMLDKVTYGALAKVAPNAVAPATKFFSSIGTGVSVGFDAGVSFSDALFNTSDTEFNQNYLIKLGVIADALSTTLDSYEADLYKKPILETATKFDCAFNMYKRIQMVAYDKYIAIEDSLDSWLFEHDTSNLKEEKEYYNKLNCH